MQDGVRTALTGQHCRIFQRSRRVLRERDALSLSCGSVGPKILSSAGLKISHPRDTGTSLTLGQCACVLFSEWQKAKNHLSGWLHKFCRRLSSEGLRCSKSFGVSRLSPLARERQIEQSVLTAAAEYTRCFRFVKVLAIDAQKDALDSSAQNSSLPP